MRGVVQGVGFRPFIWRLAHELSLTGWVRNEADRVLIEVQGAAEQVDRFEATLANPGDSVDAPAFKLPEAALVESVESRPCETCLTNEADFSIIMSQGKVLHGP